MDESLPDSPTADMSAEPAGTTNSPEFAGVPAADPGSPATGGKDAAALAKEADHASLRLAMAGDERGFSELVQRYERRACRVARNLVPSDEDAQDLVQDAFMRVFKSLDRFDFSHAFSTWLYRIVTNLAIDLLRKRRPTYSTTGPEEDEGDPEIIDESVEDPSAAMVREETVSEVQACLDSLAPHFQSALVLREFEGLPCNDIAEIVGATHVTVRWRLHRGRKLFQEEWERRERDQESARGANTPGGSNVDQSDAGANQEAGSGPGECREGAPSTALDEGGAPDKHASKKQSDDGADRSASKSHDDSKGRGGSR